MQRITRDRSCARLVPNEPEVRDEVMEELSMAILDAQEQERSAPGRGAPRRPRAGLRQRHLPDPADPRARHARGPRGRATAELVSLRTTARARAGHAARLHQPAATVTRRGGRARRRAARQRLGAVSQRSGLPIDVRLEASGDLLHAAARTVVLRVAQEALRNIAKHAEATRAWVITQRRHGTRWQLSSGCSKSATTAAASTIEDVSGASQQASLRPAFHARAGGPARLGLDPSNHTPRRRHRRAADHRIFRREHHQR